MLSPGVAQRILYLGENRGTSLHRAQALGRLGHEVEVLDPWELVPGARTARRLSRKLLYRAGGRLFEPWVVRRLGHLTRHRGFDLAWVNGGELIGPTSIGMLKERCAVVLNYNNDDPFGARDGARFAQYRRAVGAYDLLAVVRDVNLEEAIAAGARKVVRVPMSADECAHAFAPEMAAERVELTAVFVGTWMPGRDDFLAKLLDLGVPLKIHGMHWQRAPNWNRLRHAFAGPAIYGGEYVRALRRSVAAIGLLSHENRDLHTRRSVEIPFAGSVLCAERTSEHRAMYAEDEEALFWSTPEECAAKVRAVIANHDLRMRLAEAGRRRCLANGTLNQPVLEAILGQLAPRPLLSKVWGVRATVAAHGRG